MSAYTIVRVELPARMPLPILRMETLAALARTHLPLAVESPMLLYDMVALDVVVPTSPPYKVEIK